MPIDVKEAFTQKIGPLPAVAWAGMAGGTFVVYRYIKARQQAASGATTGQVVDTQSEGFGLSQDSATPWGSTGGGGTSGGSSVVTPTTTGGAPQTNVDWGTLAENWGIGQGFNPTDVATALGSYLYGTGQTLNSTQSAILQAALHQFGGPPEGIIIPPPTTSAPPIVTVAPSAPTPTQDVPPPPKPQDAPYVRPAPVPVSAPQPISSQADYFGMLADPGKLNAYLRAGGLIAGPNDQGLSSAVQIKADLQDRINKGQLPASVLVGL